MELGDATINGLVLRADCGLFACDYNATNLVGHFLGGLLIEKETGNTSGLAHITFLKKVISSSTPGCPKTELDVLFKSLKPLYLRP